MRPTLRIAAGLLPALLLLQSCMGTRTLAHPTVRIQTAGGVELGVVTDYGLVFLGRTARAGDIDVTAWFGDGPSIERAVIEPISPDLCTAETEIRLPSVPLAYRDPKPGETLVLVGRTLYGFYDLDVVVREEPRVEGIVIDVPPELDGLSDQIGAGLFEVPERDFSKARLVGLVSARLRIETAEGPREYLAVLGPRELWRLVTLRRDQEQRRRWVYRDDIL